MVYRGKPSAGCENCRKAKKKCTLEQPACSRCVKLNKPCSGYRDTTGLQIQDETLSVTRKAERKKAQQVLPITSHTTFAKSSTATPTPDPTWSTQVPSFQNSQTQFERSLIPQSRRQFGKLNLCSGSATPSGTLTPQTTYSDSSSSSEGTVDVYGEFETHFFPLRETPSQSTLGDDAHEYVLYSIPGALGPKPDEIATSYFLNCFTASGHWDYILKYAETPRLDPCLTMAIKACGMAALENVQNVPHGRAWSRSMYMNAITLLNTALRDPERSKTDESLIAVSMLSFFENLVCDSKQSIQSWKAHVAGATQLLKMRGKAQFKSSAGRALFRETRSQILIHCIWDELEPPPFLIEWNVDLQAQDKDPDLIRPADVISDICYDYAKLEHKLKINQISDEQALAEVADIDRRMVQWSIDTVAMEERWRYYDLQVDDSPEVWNGMVHAYACLPAPGVWNMCRGVRIMVTRTQELLALRFNPSPAARQSQHSYFRAIRRQLTDEICATIPVSLGHSRPAFSSPCVLITAYNSIWPLFFAGTCVLERIGQSASNGNNAMSASSSAAIAQLAWILGRFDFISQHIGLRWADGVAATLRGDFNLHDTVLPELAAEVQKTSRPPELQRVLEDGTSKPEWIMEVEQSGRGPRVLIEGERALPRGPGGLWDDGQGPKWLGRLAEHDEAHIG